MKNNFFKFIFGLFTLLFMISCTFNSSNPSSIVTKRNQKLLPAPSDSEKNSLSSQLGRFRGQTQFLTTDGYREFEAFGSTREAYGASAAAPAGVVRKEQDSDIYKIGKPGSKLLFLLNDYRGLQVISYKKGAEKPELIGRVAPTGNFPSDMYMDYEKDRIYVLERNWHSYENSVNSLSGEDEGYQSRIVVYNVSNPEKPFISEVVKVKGVIADSRIVGQVLYIASTLRDSEYRRYSSDPITSSLPRSNDSSSNNPQGFVFSYNLAGNNVEQIQELKLSLPAVHENNFKIVTAPTSEGYKYYLLASLSESGWSWWNQLSKVQVIDISDSEGKIDSIMTVSVKGNINKPNQMLVKNNTLIVVSQYNVGNDSNGNSSSRIAVETFKFPTKSSEIISESEEKLRRLYIEKQIQSKISPPTKTTQTTNITQSDSKSSISKTSNDEETEVDDLKTRWINDKTWGLSGRFTKINDELHKVIADSTVTAGDTRGQRISLQDVRFQDNLLYAFWVPSNNIDPLDIFDISRPEVGVKHLSRLEFDGWISRSEPLTYMGKNYILGLGWVVPAVNNENNKRYAQAKLFEINKNTLKAVEVFSLVLDHSHFWADFSQEDKFIEFKIKSEGLGEILFQGTSYQNSQYQDGGKLIEFNLGNLNKNLSPLSEGAFLVSDSSWLKRIFTNSEISRINSISDENLATFSDEAKSSSSIDSTEKTLKAAHILELARNVMVFENMNSNGLQIVGESSGWGLFGNDETSRYTQLRLVPLGQPDAEKSTILSQERVLGNYKSHFLDPKTNTLFLVTSTEKYTEQGIETKYFLYQITTIESNRKLHVVPLDSWFHITNYDNEGREAGLNISVFFPENTSDFSSLLQWTNQDSHFLKLNSSNSNNSDRKNNAISTSSSNKLLLVTKNQIRVIDILKAKDESKEKSMSVSQINFNNCDINTKEDSMVLSILGGQLYLNKKRAMNLETKFSTYQKVTKNDLMKLTLNEKNKALECGNPVNIPGDAISIQGDRLIVKDSWVVEVKSSLVENENGEKQPRHSLITKNSYTSLKLNSNVASDNQSSATLVDVNELSKSSSTKLTQDGQLISYISNENSVRYYAGSEFHFLNIDENGFFTEQVFDISQEEMIKGSLEKIFYLKKENSYLGIISGTREFQIIKFSNNKKRPEVVKMKRVLEDGKADSQSFHKLSIIGSSYSEVADKYHYTPEQKAIEISNGYFGVLQVILDL